MIIEEYEAFEKKTDNFEMSKIIVYKIIKSTFT